MRKKISLFLVFVLAVSLFSGTLSLDSKAAEKKSVTVAQPQTNIVGDISLIREINSKEELESTMQLDRLPSTVILNIDSSLNALGSDGKGFATVAEVITALDYKVIPAFNVANQATVVALCQYLDGIGFYDICVMSKDVALVKSAKEAMPAIRGVIDYTEKYTKALTSADLVEIRKTTMQYNAYIALLPAQLCTREAVQHLYDGRIMVWSELSEKASLKDKYSAILSGAIGVISDDAKGMFEIACDKLEADTMTRKPLNVGHKGMPIKELENTIAGGKAAVEAGADVLEIDLYLSKDGHLIIMHNYKTGGNCDKDLVIADSTLAELKELNVIQNEDGTGKDFTPRKIPTLEEFFQEFKDSDVRFFLEFKGGGSEIVKATKKLVDDYDMYDRCTAIAFDPGVMQLIRDLWAEMPIGYLNFAVATNEGSADSDFATKIMPMIGKYNATYSPSISTQGSKAGSRASMIRGVAINGWTYYKQSTYLVSYMSGAPSITGDDASAMAEYPTAIAVNNLENGKKVQQGKEIALDVTEFLYKGQKSLKSGLDCLVLEGDGVVVMNGNKLTFNKAGTVTFLLKYKHDITSINAPTLYSEPITVTVIGDGSDDEYVNAGNNGGAQGNGGTVDSQEPNQGADNAENGGASTGDTIWRVGVTFVMLAAVSFAVMVYITYRRKI